jgi:hypothetical protein
MDRFWFVFGDRRSLSFGANLSTRNVRWRFALFAPTLGHRMAIAIGTNTEEVSP